MISANSRNFFPGSSASSELYRANPPICDYLLTLGVVDKHISELTLAEACLPEDFFEQES